jgi:2-polyprenyl-3-methyl-5-hydroxy-6-metoxy-1,4-benzoquinol methylase
MSPNRRTLEREAAARAADATRRALGERNELVHHTFTRANNSLRQGNLDEAVAFYKQILALNPNLAEAHSNLGVALQALGKLEEAAAAYRSALAINPKLVAIYINLGHVLVAQGNVIEAIALARRALIVAPTKDTKAFFVECIRGLPPAAPPNPAFDRIAPLIARALTEGWGRPEDLSGFACELVKRRFAANDPLLHALLVTAPVRDIELEHLLTQERRRVLVAGDDKSLAFACALARQCFINEYIFAREDEEFRQAMRLRDTIAAGGVFSPLQVAMLAAYVPLHTLPNAEKLLEHKWPVPLTAVLDEQVRQPLQERSDRVSVPALTEIEDPVSRMVREQYEEMPFPRWTKPALVGDPMRIDHRIRGQIRLAPLRPLGRLDRIDILVAGCGTGLHAIETAKQYAGAQVLAIDLSLSSLCYARRMTRALGVQNIEYAQADILKLGAIGRRFDVIEAVGVLHHLADPQAGWRVLLSLLRPAGLMFVGLYSKSARRDINAVRDFIAQRGYGHTADDIRNVRQELMAMQDDVPLKSVTKFWDFYTTSTCHDLLFNVQEHQFNISDIKAFLAGNELTFLGFIDPALQQLYRARFPHDATMTDLDFWHALEAENPRIFSAMYQFWVQKQ